MVFDKVILRDNVSQLVINNRFNNQVWRQLLSEVAKTIDPQLQIIAPFGFELTQNLAFLSKRLRRFFCYIGFPPLVRHPFCKFH